MSKARQRIVSKKDQRKIEELGKSDAEKCIKEGLGMKLNHRYSHNRYYITGWNKIVDKHNRCDVLIRSEVKE